MQDTYRPYEPQHHDRATRIPREAWDQRRPIIEQLYMHQDLSLPQLATTMSERFGFTAKYFAFPSAFTS